MMSGGVGQEDSVPVKEVLLTGLGHKNNRPMLIAFVEQDLLIYEAFTFTEASVEGHLNLRFRKVCFTTSLNPLSYCRLSISCFHNIITGKGCSNTTN